MPCSFIQPEVLNSSWRQFWLGGGVWMDACSLMCCLKADFVAGAQFVHCSSAVTCGATLQNLPQALLLMLFCWKMFVQDCLELWGKRGIVANGSWAAVWLGTFGASGSSGGIFSLAIREAAEQVLGAAGRLEDCRLW
jgi:hypothetical protein